VSHQQQRDVIQVLEEDHREIEKMFTELESLRIRDLATGRGSSG
jgi:hypothetical protein